MKEVGLVVDPSSIVLCGSGPATGNIALSIAGTWFPATGWNDFVVVILEAWLSALVRIVRGTSDTERVHFMEGPYAVDLARVASGAIQVRTLERPNRQHGLLEVMPLTLVENAVSVADAVVVFCRQHGHHSRDVERLATSLEALRHEGRNLKGTP